MYVKIGKYRNWFGPYQLADLLRKIKVPEKACVWVEESLPQAPFQWVYDKFGQRKVKVRIDDYDVWNMDTTLAPIILPMLIKIRKDKYGTPGCMPAFDYADHSGETFAFYEDSSDEVYTAAEKEWGEIVDKMIFSFSEIQRDWSDEYHKTPPELIGKELVGGDFDFVGYQKHAEKIQEGFELFGKYYQNLWT